jgi:hypothetical protein
MRISKDKVATAALATSKEVTVGGPASGPVLRVLRLVE